MTPRPTNLRRIRLVVVAVVLGLVSVGSWLAAQDMHEVSSPLGPGEWIQDRAWDTRWLLLAGVAAASSMVVAAMAATMRAVGDGGGDGGNGDGDGDSGWSHSGPDASSGIGHDATGDGIKRT